MKNKLPMPIFIIFCIIALSNTACSAKNTASERPTLEDRQEHYIEIKDTLKLNTRELAIFNEINAKETWAIRPLALELEANYLRLNELNQTKCKWYSRACKKELKTNKAFVDADIKELKRQIWQKKEYYKILYLNQTSRRQDLKLRQIIQSVTNSKPQLW